MSERGEEHEGAGELHIEQVVEVGGQPYELLQLLLEGTWLVRGPEGQLRWLWVGPDPSGWAERLGAALEAPPRLGLPRVVGTRREPGRTLLLLEHRCPAQGRALREQAWRAMPPDMALEALQRLALNLSTLHEAGLGLGGLAREHLLWDERRGCLYIASMPGAVELEPGSIEDVWRDIRLIGELLFESLCREDYPGGHELAAILQDAERTRRMGLTQPGLPQALAGCVTPYGDLAHRTAHELWVALESLRVEVERPLRLRAGGHSTVGTYLFRQNNQDACGWAVVETICGSRLATLGFFCVADGIGGIEDGERASSLAVRAGCEAFGRAWARRSGQQILAAPVATARGITKVVSQRLALEGEFDPQGNRGGTTFSALLIAGRRAGLAHVGDSRVWLLRRGRLHQLSADHSLATILEALGELEDRDEVGRAAAERTISRYLTTGFEIESARIDSFSLEAARALEISPEVLVDQGLPLERGDLFVLTSDGAHGAVSPSELLELALDHTEPRALCEAIVGRATSRVAQDNVTALAVLVE